MGTGIKGFKSQKMLKTKLRGYTEDQSVDPERYATIQELTADRYGLDVVSHGLGPVTPNLTAQAGSNVRVIISSAPHGANKGDIVKFQVSGIEASVMSTPDATTIIMGCQLDFDPTALMFDVLRHVTPKYGLDGAITVVTTTAPTQYVLDGIDQKVVEDTTDPTLNRAFPSGMFIKINGVTYPVEKDTVVPANTVSVPVEITGASGPINITAGDLNVQLSDQGPNADVTRIGNGTNQWGINASTEGLVHDADLLAAVQGSSSIKLMSEFLYFDYTGVSDAGYTELIAATLDTVKAFTWFESSGQPMVVALGAIGLEVDKFVIPPGGFNGEISMDIPLGSRISIKQLNAEVLGSGIMIVANFLK